MNNLTQNTNQASEQFAANANYLDIVFDGRNKAYGAYDLRRNYEGNIKHAIFITILLGCSIVVSAILLNPYLGVDKMYVQRDAATLSK